MYQLTATITEYPTAWRVSLVLSVTTDDRQTRKLGAKELWLEPVEGDVDPLEAALRVMRRAATIELRP